MSLIIDHGPEAALGGLRCANPPYVSPWYVAVAGLILLTACHFAYADPGLGRLFNTPAERSALDANRGKVISTTVNGPAGAQVQPGAPSDYFLPPGVPGNMPPPGAQGAQPGSAQPGMMPPAGTQGLDPDAPPPAPPAPEQLEMNGVVRSSSGRSTVWLNNVPQSGPQNKFSNRNKKALTVTLPSGKKVLLRPGQRYDLADGRVKDINEP
ncbi:hypothetical protein NHH88_20550 [Oxalobacteraceae bacterium OTU3CAMAD1]|nr:hypothetical protein NHH88_20550 [Oxalobacteraceae bacterium OTU3CAMAD1]